MRKYKLIFFLAAILLVSACSSTKSIPEGDQLYIGISDIKYDTKEQNTHFFNTREEMDAALATPPNGALFGSSKVRTPFPFGLWIWNEFVGTESGFGKWMLNSFGSKPILMSWVNPELRETVGKEVLRAHGYFRGNVDHEVITVKNPKKAKIKYNVHTGHLFTIDSLSYSNFTAYGDSLIRATEKDAKIKKNDPFSVAALEAERNRVSTLFRNNGYFFYQPNYASYLADTLTVPGKVQLKFQQLDSLPEVAKHKWYLGNVDVDLRRQFTEELDNTTKRRVFTLHYNGKKAPLRYSLLRNSIKFEPGELYNYADHQETMARLAGSGLFSLVDFNFTPRDTTGLNDTLDVNLNCVFDKRYDFFIEANMTGKTSNRFGPGGVIGLTKRNAFRGGELLTLNLRGNYEWQTNYGKIKPSSQFNSYQYGFDISLQYPRLVIPFVNMFGQRRIRTLRNSRFYSPPTTTFKVSSDIISRSGYFKRHVVSGDWTYNFQTSPTSRHQFSPLMFSLEYMRISTDVFDSIMGATPYLLFTMRNQFVPKMQYIYTYTSPAHYRNPIWWQTTLSESANILSLGYMAAGHRWNEHYKMMFSNPYAQFLKLESEWVKTWRLSERSSIVAHAGAGVIWTFGNSTEAPYSEQFYVGGANSIRAFPVRFVGPGSYHDPESALIYYLSQTGDIKLQANLEYRPRLFGNLYGALFLDAGNVWEMRESYRTGGSFKLKNVFKEMALGTGVGLRYDLDFLVIRVDWGLGLHLPYKPGFYNVGAFKDSHSLHFAVGYPF